MKLLFDTHAFIWWESEPSKLSPHALAACQDTTNSLILSVASIWDMQIKLQLGKLNLGLPLANIVENQQEANQVEIMPIRYAHVLELDKLPLHHRDPFERVLVAQANIEGAFLVTADPLIANYSVQIL